MDWLGLSQLKLTKILQMKSNRSMARGFFLSIILAGQALIANADVPPLINYQGQLTDASGNPQTGTMKLEFNIYDAASGGNKIWGPQTFNGIPLIGGRFNVMLGSTDAAGNAITSAFSGNSRFLGIKVDNGTEVTPRQQILSTPFAIQALSASNADNAVNAVNAVSALHGVPPGTIVAYWSNGVPNGWLLCDGSGIPAGVAYDKLRTLIGANVPDLRGMFLRGLNKGRNDGKQDPEGGSRVLGDYQTDMFASHTHQERPSRGTTWFDTYRRDGNWGSERDGNILDMQTGPTGGSETRSKNVAVNWIIKY